MNRDITKGILKHIGDNHKDIRLVVICTDSDVTRFAEDLNIPLAIGQLSMTADRLSDFAEPEWMDEAVEQGLEQAVRDGGPTGGH